MLIGLEHSGIRDGSGDHIYIIIQSSDIESAIPTQFLDPCKVETLDENFYPSVEITMKNGKTHYSDETIESFLERLAKDNP